MAKSTSGATAAPSPHTDVWYDLVSLLVQYNVNFKVRREVLRYLNALNEAGTTAASKQIAYEARQYLNSIL